jgi:hypothetical protein
MDSTNNGKKSQEKDKMSSVPYILVFTLSSNMVCMVALVGSNGTWAMFAWFWKGGVGDI